MGRVKTKQPYMPVKASNEDWETPPKLFDPLNDEFHFTLDVAANEHNTKCAKYFDKKANGLNQPWKGEIVWCNPPYNAKALDNFTAKALYEAQENDVVSVLLVPAKTDQKWFHRLWSVRQQVEFRWVRGRIKFVGAANGSTFSSVVIVIRPNKVPDDEPTLPHDFGRS
jgi:phage N-6-adenine-methyltransferase